MSEEIILPKVPSELLRIALDDLRATIAQGYSVDMGSWGKGKKKDGVENCSVCLAGSVMLQTVKKENQELSDFNPHGVNYKQFLFLDSIRQGELRNGLEFIIDIQEATPKYLEFTEYIPNWVEYEDEETAVIFFKQLEELIEYFKTINL